MHNFIGFINIRQVCSWFRGLFYHKYIFPIALHQVTLTGKFFQVRWTGKQLVSLPLERYNLFFMAPNVVFQIANLGSQAIAVYEIVDIKKGHPQQKNAEHNGVAIPINRVIHFAKMLPFSRWLCTEFRPVRISVLLQVHIP